MFLPRNKIIKIKRYIKIEQFFTIIFKMYKNLNIKLGILAIYDRQRALEKSIRKKLPQN